MQTETYKSILRWGILAVFFVIPFLPLYIASDLLFPYITGRNFAFRLLIEIAFVLWLGLVVMAKEYRPKPSKILGAVLVFLIVIGLADFFGINPYHSFWSNYERMEGYLLLLHLGAFFVMLSTVLKQKKEWFWYLAVVVVGSMFSAGYALLQKFGVYRSLQGGTRVDGTIGNPAYLAAYLLFSVALSMLLFFLAEKKYQKYVFEATALFALLIIYFTATRGTMIGLLAGAFAGMLGYLSLMHAETPREKLFKKYIWAGIFIVIAVPIIFYILRDSAWVKQSPTLTRLTSISLTDKTIRSRFMIWNMAWQGVKERPLLGWGQENFVIIFNKFYNPQLFDQEPWFDRSHNIVFDWLVNGGILGLLSYFSLFGASLISLWQAYRRKQMYVFECIIISSLFIAYIINNFFVFDNFNTYFIFFSLLAYIAARASSERAPSYAVQEKQQTYSRPQSAFNSGARGAWALVVVVAAGVGMAFVAYQVNMRGYLQSQALIDALQGAGQSKTLQEIKGLFNQALAYDSFGNTEAREQFAQFAQNVINATQVSKEERFGFLQESIKEMEKQVQETPQDAKYHLFLANLYLNAAQFDNSFLQKTETELFAALQSSPARQQIYFTIATFYVNVGMYDKAIEAAEKAIALAPNNRVAHITLAQIAILAKRDDLVDKAMRDFEEVVGNDQGMRRVEYPKLTSVYAQMKNFTKTAEYYKRLVQIVPEYAEYHAGLAQSYFELHQYDLAIQEAKEAARLDPASYGAQAEQFIKSMQTAPQGK